MTYLILGDIHGNLPAFEKILKAEKNSYDILISHGDVINYGPWSNECVELLENQISSIKIKGNHETYFINGEYPGNNIIAKTFFELSYPKFNKYKEIKNYLNSYEIDNYLITHTINDKYIFSDTNINDLIINTNHIIGHSHQQFIRELNGYELINTGSVGQNRKYINVSNYILLDSVKRKVELKQIINDIDILINELKIQNYSNICIDYYKNKSRINE